MGSAPSPDKNMGIAALKSAKTGEQYLDWMKTQAKITNDWAAEDRARYIETFQPIEDQFVEDSVNYDTPERRASAMRQAGVDTKQQIALAQQSNERNMASMGVSPTSGKSQAVTQRSAIQSGLATAGAREMARRNVEETGYARTANAVNLGQGLAVNPAQSVSISNGAASSGFQGAMQGYGQQASILSDEYNQRMQAWQSNMGVIGSIAGGLGNLAGIGLSGGFAVLSSKKAKTNKTEIPEGEALRTVMDLPVENWSYKPGMGADGGEGRHVGTYAEDFTRETGLGDGQKLDIADAVGVTMAAVKDLGHKIDKFERRVA